jgi:hypothetical protein
VRRWGLRLAAVACLALGLAACSSTSGSIPNTGAVSLSWSMPSNLTDQTSVSASASGTAGGLAASETTAGQNSADCAECIITVEVTADGHVAHLNGYATSIHTPNIVLNGTFEGQTLKVQIDSNIYGGGPQHSKWSLQGTWGVHRVTASGAMTYDNNYRSGKLMGTYTLG